MIEMNESDSGSLREFARGEEFQVSLPENPTTGYRWQFNLSGTGKLDILEDRFEPGAGGGAGMVPGAGGRRLMRLMAKESGTVNLEALERRAWETASPARQTRGFSIKVR
jgi:inhibitor of cysteine peptidase